MLIYSLLKITVRFTNLFAVFFLWWSSFKFYWNICVCVFHHTFCWVLLTISFIFFPSALLSIGVARIDAPLRKYPRFRGVKSEGFCERMAVSRDRLRPFYLTLFLHLFWLAIIIRLRFSFLSLLVKANWLTVSGNVLGQ